MVAEEGCVIFASSDSAAPSFPPTELLKLHRREGGN